MNELKKQIYTELYRPKTFGDLILSEKAATVMQGISDNLTSLPSFIFFSSAGTGKTSCAKVIINTCECDYLTINSSDERGIDTIREKVKLFARSLSSNGRKRCVFLDEFDGIGSIAMASLKNIMETYSDNCFFIFTANDISKIIEPIQSRCIIVDFNNPPKPQIGQYLEAICKKEDIKIETKDLEQIMDNNYPDIRAMINRLQEIKLGIVLKETSNFQNMLEAIKKKDVEYISNVVFSKEIDISKFNKQMFYYIFENCKSIGLEKCGRVAFFLADTEKHSSLPINLEIIFMNNILGIMEILQ